MPKMQLTTEQCVSIVKTFYDGGMIEKEMQLFFFLRFLFI